MQDHAESTQADAPLPTVRRPSQTSVEHAALDDIDLGEDAEESVSSGVKGRLPLLAIPWLLSRQFKDQC